MQRCHWRAYLNIWLWTTNTGHQETELASSQLCFPNRVDISLPIDGIRFFLGMAWWRWDFERSCRLATNPFRHPTRFKLRLVIHLFLLSQSEMGIYLFQFENKHYLLIAFFFNRRFTRSSFWLSASLLASILLNLSIKQLLTWWYPIWPGWASLLYSPSTFGEWTHHQTRKRINVG